MRNATKNIDGHIIKTLQIYLKSCPKITELNREVKEKGQMQSLLQKWKTTANLVMTLTRVQTCSGALKLRHTIHTHLLLLSNCPIYFSSARTSSCQHVGLLFLLPNLGGTALGGRETGQIINLWRRLNSHDVLISLDPL